VRKDDIAARRDLLTRFLKASIEGNDIALTDEKRAKEVLAKELKIGSANILDITYNDFKQQSPRSIEPTAAAAANTLAQFSAGGSTDPAAFIDTSVLDDLRTSGAAAALERKYKF